MSERVPRLPFVLMIVMTIATLGGPLVFGLFLRGGASPQWPPDRAVEWVMLAATSGLVASLMGFCFWLGWCNFRDQRQARSSPTAPRSRQGDDAAT